MGASFNTMTVKFCKIDDLKKIYNNEIENLRYEYGADPYNGTFTTCSGLRITSMVFDDIEKAEDWLRDNTEKWEAVKAVEVKTKDRHIWKLGGWCSE